MKVGMLTREWPPEIYGGAGVHVDQLVAHLRPMVDVEVHCFGPDRPDATAHQVPAALISANPALGVLGVDLEMAAATAGLDLLHSHTWYTNFAGHTGALLHGVPHVLTAHSLEPLRPWKQEQLGGGYLVSSWVERTAYASADAIIAVSNGMRTDVLNTYPFIDPTKVHVIHNGIDTELYSPDPDPGALTELGVDSTRPYVLFVGRITRQKGLLHLINSARNFADDLVLVLAASAPDTEEIAAQTAQAVGQLRAVRGQDSVVWLKDQVARPTLIKLFSGALAFVCPSVYEPLGIVNLEAMACQTAVVASAVGGIPEVVVDGITGLLVHYEAADLVGFERDFAAAVNILVANPGLAGEMGAAGRTRAQSHFGWRAIAERTVTIYQQVLNK
ncbi:MAG: glycogen synthase [Actinobacteria bacterium]|nr:MAG: glycogen synthase [Actinomycetota bacterium]